MFRPDDRRRAKIDETLPIIQICSSFQSRLLPFDGVWLDGNGRNRTVSSSGGIWMES
jgi:hypothetical protein